MRVIPKLAALLLTVSASACIIEDDSRLYVSNDSNFEVHEMYIVDVDNPSWGSNLLRGDILFPGDEISVGVDCGYYDALLVDETNAMCEVHDLDLCLNDAHWVIRNNTCAVFGARISDKHKLEKVTPAPASNE